MNGEDSNYISYLMQLKKNPQKWNDMKRLYHLLSIIGEHPDALQILGNLQLIDRDNVQVMQKNRIEWMAYGTRAYKKNGDQNNEQ